MPTESPVIEVAPANQGVPVVTELAITGMTCGNCARHVTQAIQGVSGVRSAFVSLDAQRAKVSWEADAQPDLGAVIKAVENEGFGAKIIEADAPGHGEHRLA